jgi:hypothetical protein
MKGHQVRIGNSWVKAVIFVGMILSTISTVRADTWYGTAPFCDGQCPPGQTQIATSNCGDGACCWTGHKVLCRNSNPTCQALQTNTACYGIILVCDNGSYDYRMVWTSCSKYVCGLCFGFSW